MQAVIFAAGRGTRMRELTDTTPKSMLPLFNKPILEYKIEALPESIDEVILVVGYLGGVIHDHFGPEYNGRRILYVEQETPAGTADALWQAKDALKEKFVVTNGDDLYSKADTDACIAAARDGWSLLTYKKDEMGSGGKIVLDENQNVVQIIEGTHQGSGLIGAGMYVLDQRIFNYTPVPKGPGEKEVGLPQTMMTAARDIQIHAVPATFWIQITAPEDLKKAEAILEHGVEQ